jgi:hypothetical protein
MLFFGAIIMLISTVVSETFGRIRFLGHPLTFMMVYLWARDPENYHIRMSFFGVVQFNAPYLPWVLLIFSLVLGNPVEMDVLGIIVGHTYYFLDSIYPQVANVRGWSIKKIIVTPSVLHYLCSSNPIIHVETDVSGFPHHMLIFLTFRWLVVQIFQQAGVVAPNLGLNPQDEDRNNLLRQNENLHLHND